MLKKLGMSFVYGVVVLILVTAGKLLLDFLFLIPVVNVIVALGLTMGAGWAWQKMFNIDQ